MRNPHKILFLVPTTLVQEHLLRHNQEKAADDTSAMEISAYALTQCDLKIESDVWLKVSHTTIVQLVKCKG